MSKISRDINTLKFYEKPEFINAVLFLTYLILFILKLIFSIISNSLALRADAFDNLTDIIMYATAFFGFFFIKKQPNKKYPYGYYKIENIISLIFSLFIFYTAYNIMLQSIISIISYFEGKPNIVYFSLEIFIFLIVSITISTVISLYLHIIGKKTDTPIIKSEAKEKKYDILISMSVIIGFIGAFFNLYLLDSILGLIICGFIIKGGYEILKNSMKTLLDAVVEFDERIELYELIKDFPKIKEVKYLEIRSFGRYIFVEVDIFLSEETPQYEVDNLKIKLNYEIINKFPKIFKVNIITHGKHSKIKKIAVPLEDNLANNSPICDHFGESPYFALMDYDNNKLLNIEFLKNPFIEEEKRKGLLVSEFLTSKKIDKIYLKKSLNKGPLLIFNNNFVEIEITALEKLGDIINQQAQ